MAKHKNSSNEQMEMLTSKDYKLNSVNIRLASNGFSVSFDMTRKKPKKGNGETAPSSYHDESMVFNDLNSMLEKVKEVLEEHEGNPGDEDY